MSPKQRTRLTPDERISRILDAAEQVFGDSGFRKGSIKDVADAVGLSVQGVLHYFGTKEELLLATLDRINAAQAQLRDRIREEQGAIAFMRFYLTQNESIQASGTCSSPSRPRRPAPTILPIRSLSRNARERERKAIEEDIRLGRVPSSLDPGESAAAIIALSDGLQLQKLLRTDLDLLSAFDAATESYRNNQLRSQRRERIRPLACPSRPAEAIERSANDGAPVKLCRA